MTSILIIRGEETQAHTQESRAWSDIAIVKEHQEWPGAARSQDLESEVDSSISEPLGNSMKNQSTLLMP